MSRVPPPNPEADDIAACRRKRRYRDRDEAIYSRQHRQAAGAPKLRVYACPCCRGFHLTKWIVN